jgi:hypothetical protein
METRTVEQIKSQVFCVILASLPIALSAGIVFTRHWSRHRVTFARVRIQRYKLFGLALLITFEME